MLQELDELGCAVLSGFRWSRVSGPGLIDWQSYEEKNAPSGSRSPTYG
jgi:hypothetical protein